MASYGGSALTGENYTNILKLSDKAENLERESRRHNGSDRFGQFAGVRFLWERYAVRRFKHNRLKLIIHKLTVGMNDPL